MKRREFITLLGGAAAWPGVARAQQTAKRPTIGYLGSITPDANSSWNAAFSQRLRELGWVEDRTIRITYRWAEGYADRATEIAAEFVRMNVDVIVAQGTAQIEAAKAATTTIPIVFPSAADPVGTGLVASLARPGGNVTGLSVQTSDLAGKRLELLREVIPSMRVIGLIGNIGSRGVVLEINEVRDAAGKLGLDVFAVEIRQVEDIVPAFKRLRNQVDALYICSDPFMFEHRIGINILAAGARLATAHLHRDYVASGGFMAYGPDFPDLFRRAAEYVDKILRGTKPSDIPVEQPTKFTISINLATASAIGLTIPTSLLAHADEVIE